jgi:hypothetical protein
MINTRIQADLVHNGDASCLDLTLKLEHGRRDIASGDHVLLLANSGFDDCCMEGVWDETNHQIGLGNFSIESVVFGDIEGDGSCVFDAFAEFLCVFQSTTGF